jgi:hypothetical protein
VAAEEEQALQVRQPADYYAMLAHSFFIASSTSLILQESFKILLIAIVSQQYLPEVAVLQGAPWRLAARMCIRGLFGVAYALLRAM